MRLLIVPLSVACLLVTLPAVAGVRHGAVTQRGADGSVARVHGSHTTDGAGRSAWHEGGSRSGHDGSGSHARASGISGANGSVARGGRTTRGSDGTLSHQLGHVIHGANGGSEQAGRSVQRNPDGSLQGSYGASGQGAAGGRFASNGTRTRSADGERFASRQTTASGTRGSYAGSTTRGDGTLDHTGTLTGQQGDTYQGQTSYSKGAGISHSGSCTNAQGQTVQC